MTTPTTDLRERLAQASHALCCYCPKEPSDYDRSHADAALAVFAEHLTDPATVEVAAKAVWQWTGGLGPWAEGDQDDRDSAMAGVRVAFSAALAAALAPETEASDG